MMRTALATLSMLVVAPQSTRPIFEVVETVGTLKFVKSTRAGASAYVALLELQALGAFQLNLEIASLRTILEKETVTLAFDKMEAVSLAELIAVSAGLDLVTERLPPKEGEEGPGKLSATVVRAPSVATNAGRQRLRDWGLRWYRNLLKSELRKSRETADAESRVQIDLALLDMEQGNLAAAAQEFQRFADKQPNHPAVPLALVKEAECYFEMGQLAQCAVKSRRVMTNYRDSEHGYGIEAALLFARANLTLAAREMSSRKFAKAMSTLDNVVLNLELLLWGFRDQREFPSLLLLIAEAHRRRGRFDLVLEKIRQLESVVDIILLPDEPWAAAHFLRGCAEIHEGDVVTGEKLLWLFLQKRPKDTRAGSAWLNLAEAQMKLDDPLQAVFAARRALANRGQLMPRESSRAFVIEARSLIGLGKFDEAVDQVLVEIRKVGAVQVPELVMWLADTMFDRGLPERAKAVAEPVAMTRSEYGDRARLLVLECEARQGNHARVVDRGRAFADFIRDPQRQARVSELIGDAYTALGMKKLAAAAYNGRLQ